MSRGTGLEHGGKQGIAQPATHSQPSQRRRLLCKQLFTTGFVARVPPPVVLTQPNAANNCGATAAPPPQRPPGGGWPRAVEEHPWGHMLPALLPAEPGSWLERDGSRVLLAALQPQQSEQSFFPPKSSLPRAWSGPGCSLGLCGGTAPWAAAWGRFPQPLAWGRGPALAPFPWGVATPSILGRKRVVAGCLPAGAGISVGSHGDVGISVGTGGQAELQTPSWTQTSGLLPAPARRCHRWALPPWEPASRCAEAPCIPPRRTPAPGSPCPCSAGKGFVPREAPSLPRGQGWSRRAPMTVLSVPLRL